MITDGKPSCLTLEDGRLYRKRAKADCSATPGDRQDAEVRSRAALGI